MGALLMPFETLPLGFRFKPTDVELIDHYLRLKINGKEDDVACIKEVDICRVEPWDLPDLSAIKTNDHEWFYFCPRDRKYPNGQRSNRATEAGYWKATGKDRTIKSRKMGLIGMKKTLVFYTGRAPKGKRTNWVIHEYRTTLEELDGSHPGQGAFVLCRLFKKADELKQDDNDEASHSDEVETNTLSPNPTNISQEDIRSEPAVVQASPLSIEHSVEQQVISETMYPDRSQLNEEMAHEVDSHFNEPFYLYDPPEPYFKWQSVHANQEPVGMDDIFPTDIGDGHYGLQFQDINGGEDPISDFLDSVINPDAPVCEEAGHQRTPLVESGAWKNSSIKETGSCSGSDVEVAQQQHDVKYICSITRDKNYNEPKGNEELLKDGRLADDDDIFSDDALNRFCNLPMVDPVYYIPHHTSLVKNEDGQVIGNNGIRIRTEVQGRQVPPSNFRELQGTAARRLRLQMAEDEGYESTSTVMESGFPVLDSSVTVCPGEDFICLADLDKNTAATDVSGSVNKDEVVETGIKIRTHRQRSRSSSAKTVEQGIARRRIRLVNNQAFNTETEEAKSVVSETRTLSMEAGKNPDGWPDQKPSSLKRLGLVHLIKVMCFMFMACVGLWIGRSVFVLSS